LKLVVVILREVAFDGAKDSCECFSVELEKFTVGLGSNRQRPLFVVDKSKLTEVFSCNKSSYFNEAKSAVVLMQLETLNLTLFNNVKLFSLVTFFDNDFADLEVDLL
jgi:hypothetical protein